MVKLLKNKKIIFISLFIIITMIFIDFIPQISWLCFSPKPTIIIDPGHGGNDPGTIKGDLYEKDLNLNISKKLRNYLALRGFKVIMTRDSDKTVSLKDRSKIANKEKPDIFISIHVNSNTNHRIKGMEVYWHTPQSREFAEKIYESLNNNQLTSYNRGLLNSRFYVIRKTLTPAVLIEIGYITNYYDRCNLINDENQSQIVDSIGAGIINYVKSSD